MSNFRDTGFVLTVIALTGFGFASLAPSRYYILFFIVVLLTNLSKVDKLKIPFNREELKRLGLVIFPFSALLTFQFFTLGSVPIGTYIDQFGKLLLYFITSYLILKDLKNKFHVHFVKIMTFITVISFVFYPTQFHLPLQDLVKDSLGSVFSPLGYESGDVPERYISKTLIFFTYHHNYGHTFTGLPRNCGAFWEPGVFGFFLVAALAFNLLLLGRKLYSWRNMLFLAGVITTFSTTAILGTFLVYLYYFVTSGRISRTKKLVFLSLLVFVFVNFVWQLEFIGGKIVEKFADADSDMSSRFGAVIYHFYWLRTIC
jgi:hypothetical protein